MYASSLHVGARVRSTWCSRMWTGYMHQVRIRAVCLHTVYMWEPTCGDMEPPYMDWINASGPSTGNIRLSELHTGSICASQKNQNPQSGLTQPRNQGEKKYFGCDFETYSKTRFEAS